MIKKSFIKSLLLIGLLGAPQKSEAFDPATLTMLSFLGQAVISVGIVSLSSFFISYSHRNAKASNIVKHQNDIAHYTAHLTVHSNDTVQTFESENPINIINTIMEYAFLYQNTNTILSIKTFITLQNGKVIKLNNIRISAKKTAALRKALYKRFVVPNLHLTSTSKMTLSLLSWPVGVIALPLLMFFS